MPKLLGRETLVLAICVACLVVYLKPDPPGTRARRSRA